MTSNIIKFIHCCCITGGKNHSFAISFGLCFYNFGCSNNSYSFDFVN